MYPNKNPYYTYDGSAIPNKFKESVFNIKL